MKRKVHRKPNVYVPIMDWWVAVMIVIAVVVCVGSIPMLIWQDISWQQTVMGSGIIILTALYLVDIAFFTHYRLEKDGLVVSSQLRHFFFPYRTISRIEQGSGWGLFSLGKHRRFALSTKSLRLTLNHGQYASISISPRLKNEFVTDLVERIDSERNARATVVKGRHEGATA